MAVGRLSVRCQGLGWGNVLVGRRFWVYFGVLRVLGVWRLNGVVFKGCGW